MKKLEISTIGISYGNTLMDVSFNPNQPEEFEFELFEGVYHYTEKDVANLIRMKTYSDEVIQCMVIAILKLKQINSLEVSNTTLLSELIGKEVEHHKQSARDYLLECIKLQSELDKALDHIEVLKHRLKMVNVITGA